MTPLDLLDQAHLGFARVLETVGPGEWERPTPCEGWTVRHLAGHVLGGERMAVVLLDGGSVAEARAAITASPPAGDLVRQFANAADASRVAFGAPGALDLVVHHPLGDVPGSQLLGFRVGDLTLHSWDLARALGGDETLDPRLVQSVWDQLEPLTGIIAAIGVFGEGPSGEVGDDEDLQRRLLDLTGRRP